MGTTIFSFATSNIPDEKFARRRRVNQKIGGKTSTVCRRRWTKQKKDVVKFNENDARGLDYFNTEQVAGKCQPNTRERDRDRRLREKVARVFPLLSPWMTKGLPFNNRCCPRLSACSLPSNRDSKLFLRHGLSS